MSDNLLRNIAILGGGTAGWMAAAALNRVLRGRAEICVYEDDGGDTKGALPSEIGTLPALRQLHEILGIDEADILRKTGGTFRLGTTFQDWSEKGRAYFHPLGEIGANLNGVAFRHHWLKLREAGAMEPFADFSVSGMAAKAGKFTKPSSDKRSVLSTLDYGYQLDMDRYCAYLRELAISRGVRHIAMPVRDARQNGETGFIETVTFQDGTETKADLFIDCTGLLIEGIFHSGVEDWSRWLACDRIVSIESAATESLAPYTSAAALDSGWQWRIALQDRTGNGAVYSSACTSDTDAATALRKSLGNEAGEMRYAKFKSGRCKTPRNRNVVALGNAAGAMEPLEGASLHMIQIGITRLIELLPSRAHSPIEAQEYNRVVGAEYERLRDFLILHYKATQRADSAFWNHCRTMQVPETLERQIAQFQSRGRMVLYDEETFNAASWAAVMIGQGMIPRRDDPFIANIAIGQLRQQAQRIHSVIQRGADSMPPHRIFLEKFCGTKSA